MSDIGWEWPSHAGNIRARKMKYVVDTCAIDRIADELFDPDSELPAGAEFYITHVQHDELNSIPYQYKDRRARLVLATAKLRPMLVPTESMVWDVSRWGQAKWGDGMTYNDLRTALDARNRRKANNSRDALIAESALKNSWILLTADRDIADVVEELGGAVHFIEAKKPLGSA